MITLRQYRIIKIHPFRNLLFALTLIAPLWTLEGPVWADTGPELGFLKPNVSLGADFTPKSGFDGHEISLRSYRLKSSIPLGSPYVSHDGALTLFQMFFTANLGLQQADISLMHGMRNIEQGTAALSALFVSNSRNMYMLSVGASLSEEINGLSSIKPVPYCLGLGTWRANDTFSLIYGLVLAYTSGVYRVDFPLFPVLGFNLRFGRNDRITVFLPLRVSYTHLFGSGFRITAFLGAESRRYRINNDSDFIYLWGRDRRVTLMLSSLSTGIRVQYDLTESIFIDGTAAFIAGRRITFLEKSDVLYREKIDPSVQVSLAAGVRFGSSGLEGEEE